jgi:hypothetical protein
LGRVWGWVRNLRAPAVDVEGWRAEFTPFTLAVLFALAAHPAVYYLLTGLNGSGLVDFAALDSARVVIPALLNVLFVAQIIAVIWAIIASGVSESRTLAGLAALLWAFGMLLITFVALHCTLYGACI